MAKSNFVDLGNFVWLDLNEDGIQDSGEPGIENVTVSLVDSLSGQVRSGAETTTDANGYFQLDNARWENAYLRFTLPDELPAAVLAHLPSHASSNSSYYQFSSRYQGDDSALDSDVDALGRSGVIAIGDDVDSDHSYDAGVHISPTVISDYVWLDADGNGKQDDGESGVARVKVKLMQGSSELGHTESAADGSYQLVAPQGGDYYLQFELPAEYVFSRFTEQHAVGVDDSKDSDANRDTGKTHVITLVTGGSNDTIDAGVYERDQLLSLGDKVWHDRDRDGVQDTGESGIKNVEVRLHDVVSGDLIKRSYTDNQGEYHFDELLPGDYQVRFIAPHGEGYIFSDAYQGGDVERDSNANAAGYSDNITLVSGVNNQSVDAGLYKAASVGDRVWHDLDADGEQDAGEPGLENITVKLMQGSTVIDSAETDAQGNYSLSSAVAGDYHVHFELPSSNEYVFSRFSEQDAPGVDDTKDSDANRETGDSHIFSLVIGDKLESVDAGLFERSKLVDLGDQVWFDDDRDGIQDRNARESGIKDVEVRLLDASDGDTLLQRTFTDNNGLYGFNELLPGEYKVKFSAPGGMAPTNRYQGGDEALDSNVDATGYSEVVNLSVGESNKGIDAGYMQAGVIGDKVWLDADGNGSYDATSEAGLAGVRVELYDGAGNYLNQFQKTDADGGYRFEGLEAGDYRVKFVTPDGYGLTKQNEGHDALDSDADQNSGLTEVITLGATEKNLAVDAGMIQGASIGDYVWHDVIQDGDDYLNGVQDANESGLAGVTVELFVKDRGSYVSTGQTDVTGNDGGYNFSGLNPGNYALRFGKEDHLITYQDQGNDDAKDSDADQETGLAYVSLSAGENVDSIDVGMAQSARMGGQILKDVSGMPFWEGGTPRGNDGLYDPLNINWPTGTSLEQWLPQAELNFYLADVNGNILESTQAQRGEYSFDVLPGTYRVRTERFSDDGIEGSRLEVANSEPGYRGNTPPSYNWGLVVLDLDNNGIETIPLSASEERLTILNIDHYEFHSGWLSPTDGILSIDANNDGKIEGYQELLLDTNQNAKWFNKLYNSLDNNNDLTIDKSDLFFNELKVWTDTNGNKQSDAGELKSLADVGVESINIQPLTSGANHLYQEDENGNTLMFQFSSKLSSGQEIETAYYGFDMNVDEIDSDFVRSYTMDVYNGSAQGTGWTEEYLMQEGDIDHAVDLVVRWSPIAIDMNNDGIVTMSMSASEAKFDLLGTGMPVQSGWLSSEDAFLAVDNNANGQIDSIAELFGGNKGDGFAKLATFDSNNDGVVDLSDEQFASLSIWQDSNSNKVTDEGELISLADAGISSLKVDYVEIPALDENGNLHLERSSATMADGAEVDMTDVYFAVAAADAAAAGLELPSMAELLSVGDNLDTLVGAQAESFVADTGVDSYQRNPLAELLDQAMVA